MKNVEPVTGDQVVGVLFRSGDSETLFRRRYRRSPTRSSSVFFFFFLSFLFFLLKKNNKNAKKMGNWGERRPINSRCVKKKRGSNYEWMNRNSIDCIEEWKREIEASSSSVSPPQGLRLSVPFWIIQWDDNQFLFVPFSLLWQPGTRKPTLAVQVQVVADGIGRDV